MKSTNHATFTTRTRQTLAATTLLAGIAFGTASITSAEPDDPWGADGYAACVKEHGPTAVCCEFYGGHQDPTDTFCEQPEDTGLAPPASPAGKPGVAPIPRVPSNSVR